MMSIIFHRFLSANQNRRVRNWEGKWDYELHPSELLSVLLLFTYARNLFIPAKYSQELIPFMTIVIIMVMIMTIMIMTIVIMTIVIMVVVIMVVVIMMVVIMVIVIMTTVTMTIVIMMVVIMSVIATKFWNSIKHRQSLADHLLDQLPVIYISIPPNNWISLNN